MEEQGTARLSYKKMTNYIIDGNFSKFINLKEKLEPDLGMEVSFGKDDYLKEFKERHGYIDDLGNIWIYFPNDRSFHTSVSTIPWFTIVENEDGYVLAFCKRVASDAREIFTRGNVRDISINTIKKTTKEHEELYNDEELKYLNSATSVYTPQINEDDDFLKRIVKTLLINLRININRFTPQFKYKYTLTNLKTALQNKTKMSVKVFAMWMEMLHTDFTIIVRSDGSTNESNLKGFIIYNSRTNEVTYKEEIKGDDIL